MYRLLALLLLIATPAFGLAQSMSAAGSGAPEIVQTSSAPTWWNGQRISGAGDSRMLESFPLWSTPDGRILAIVASAGSSGAPVAPQSPQIGSAIDWRLVDVTSFVTGGLSLKVADGTLAYAKFGRGIILAPVLPATGCTSIAPAASLENCLLETSGSVGSALLGTEFSRGDVDLDVSYGLSWLHLNDQPGALRGQPWNLLSGNETLPTLLIPSYRFANAQNLGFSAQSRWHLDREQSLDLGAALSRIQYELPGMPLAPTTLNQAALSLGVHRGEFSGQIVGRMLGPGDPLNSNQRWSSIDLGISWRAPWRGVFSIGAQNLWSSGSLPALNDPAAHEVDPSQARVPYVQYHQDL